MSKGLPPTGPSRRSCLESYANGGVIACGKAKFEGDESVSMVFGWAECGMHKNKNCLKSGK